MKRDEYMTDRPYDMQDRIVMRAAVIAFFSCLYIVLGGPL